MDDEGVGSSSPGLTSRPPTQADLVALCRHLNAQDARYVVVGGFAVIQAGLPRTTMDLDLLIATDLQNESRVYKALESLPDQAVRELQPGETSEFLVVRVADEIVVDLMQAACGIRFEEASRETVTREVDGVPIPFASPRLLWRMKRSTHRAKDAADLVFLRAWFAEAGETPPE